jgi:hemolysin III
VLLLGTSAVYHVRTWSARAGEFLRRFDHSNIYLLIAGTYTPIAYNALDGAWRVGVLSAVWILALAGIVHVLGGWWVPRPVEAALYIATGWVAIVALPRILATFGIAGISLLSAGGILYSIGAVFYALRRPRLWERVFGYHELFHVFVVLASVVFFIFMVAYVVPLHQR